MIRARCPGRNCGRAVEVPKAGLYTCRKCNQIFRVEGRAYPPEAFTGPFGLSGVMAMEDTAGRLARSVWRSLERCSRFLVATMQTQWC